MRYRMFYLVVFVLIGAVFWIKGVVFLDSDFGWHLRMGQLILEQGIPATDPFSYTMPSFAFVDHEWLTNVVLAALYPRIGLVGLAGLMAGMAVLALLIGSRGFGVGKEQLSFESVGGLFGVIPLVLAATTLLPFFGVRTQVESWLLLVLLLRVVFDELLWRRWRFSMPFFFVLWANLHGSFAGGLAILALVVGLRALRRRKLKVGDLLVLLLSILGTFVNPYGIRLWGEVWMQISDNALRWAVIEWLPILFGSNFLFVAFMGFSFLLVLRCWKQYKLEEMGVYLALLSQGFASQRHIPLWVMVALPMTLMALNNFYREVETKKIALERFRSASVVVSIGVLLIFFWQAVISIGKAGYFSESSFYPKQAVEFLRANVSEGEIFSEYAWGGYLIWRFPEKKVFIDGRMPSWRWDADLAGESDYAMEEYKSLLGGSASREDVFERYGIDTVLWPNQIRTESKQRRFGWLVVIKNRLDEMFGLDDKQQDFLLEKLSEDEWKIIYEDSVAVVYRRNSWIKEDGF